jgi:hypothetical protein
VPRSARVRARVVDVRGAVVATVHDGDLGSGASSLVWSAEDIATGQYRIVVDIDGVVSSRGVVIAR